LRLLATERSTVRAVTHALLAAPPLEEGEIPGLEEPGCHRITLSGRGASGLPAADVVAAWEAGLHAPGGALGWLLQPVEGASDVVLGAADRVAGLAAEESDELVVCVERPTPDWPARLAHPVLWPLLGDPLATDARGGGSFRWAADGSVLVRVTSETRARGITRIEVVDGSEGDAASLPETNGFDLAILSGRAAERLRARGDARIRLQRLPRWDAVYALWLNAQARWTNDPSFRRWLSGALDRESMARYLFGEQAEATYGLTGVGKATPAAARRPFSRTSSPRLALAFDRDDRNAASIAARVKAVLEQEGVVLQLVPGPVVHLRRSLEEGGAQMAIVAHRPPTGDPVLALLDTLWPLRATALEASERLERATRIEDADRRRERAAEVEAELIERGRLVPLVRLRAWLARHADLSGVESGAYGVLRFERAEWIR
jgi:hypothetical protein